MHAAVSFTPPPQPPRTVHQLLLILRFRAIALRRALRQQLFTLLGPAPLAIGGLLWALWRLLPELREPLRDWLSNPQAGLALVPALVLALFSLAALLPAAQRELFPRRRATALLDILPVGEGARLGAAWLRLYGRGLVAALLVVVALRFMPEAVPTLAGSAALLLQLGLAMTTLVPLSLILALVLRRALASPWLVIPIPLLAVVGLALLGEGVAWLLVPMLPAAAAWDRVLMAACELDALRPVLLRSSLAVHLAVAVICTFLARMLSQGRRSVLDQGLDSPATATKARQQRSQGAASKLIGDRWLMTGPLANWANVGQRRAWLLQAARDLILVRRRFSPLALLLPILALGWLLAAGLGVRKLDLALFWQGRLFLGGAALGALSLAALAPVLLRHQLNSLWLEQASGVPRRTLIVAKLWLARVLGLAIVLPGALGLAVLPLGPWHDRLVLGLEMLLAAWMVATFIGLAAFELAEQPLLGLLWSTPPALAVAALPLAYPQIWPLVLVGFLFLASMLTERAEQRLRYLEIAP